jgi:Flp pilus assembly pilin Flp
MRRLLRRIFGGDSPGQSLIEYALIIAFLSILGIAVFNGMATSLNGVWDSAGSTVDSAGTSAAQGDSTNFHHDHSWWHSWGH